MPRKAFSCKKKLIINRNLYKEHNNSKKKSNFGKNIKNIDTILV